MKETQGFGPIVNDDTRILILGSHPGVPSLLKQQYYGNPGNAFWRVVFNALDLVDPIDYAERLNLLLSHGIGLWDVYETVERKGSLDSNIKNEKLNDFESLLKNSNIQLIIANGKTAYKAIHKHPLFDAYDIVSALSTSGLNNRREKERMEQWTQAIRGSMCEETPLPHV